MAPPNGNQTNGASNKSITAPAEQHGFKVVPPTRHIERMQRHRQEQGEMGIALSELWVGIAAQQEEDNSVNIGFACHDGTYTIDFAVHKLRVRNKDVSGSQGNEDKSRNTCLPTDQEGQATEMGEFLVQSIQKYEQDNHYKFLGAGISQEVVKLSPQAPARIWAALDIVPIVIRNEEGGSMDSGNKVDAVKTVDELADSMARKCLS
jgi:alpha,alpha-trehalose phosphorylase (configuration-retaining)